MCSPVIRPLASNEPVPLDCELLKSFSVFFSRLRWTQQMEMAGVGHFPPSRQLGSAELVSPEGRPC